MMRRVFMLMMTMWALAVSPSLCVGGVLLHGCPPHVEGDGHDETLCCSDWQDEGSNPSSCSHEGDCSTDPCQQTIASRERIEQELDITDLMTIESVSVSMDAIEVDPGCSLETFQERTSFRERLPVHRSDLPLLI